MNKFMDISLKVTNDKSRLFFDLLKTIDFTTNNQDRNNDTILTLKELILGSQNS